jgi:hypothetical protein
MANDSAPATDPSLWTTRRKFGVAGGPSEVVLTDEGDARAFSVGAQVRRAHGAALELLASRGEGQFSNPRPGSARHDVTDLGRFDQITWGYLREKGYAEALAPNGIRITPRGRTAAERGIEERARLLDRCRAAASEAWARASSIGRPSRE